MSSWKYVHVNSGTHDDKFMVCCGAGGMVSEAGLWPPHTCMHVCMYTCTYMNTHIKDINARVCLEQLDVQQY